MAAGHRIGTVFVELDLDPTRYMRGQQTLLKEAQNGATILEKNFKNLGIKSDATYDLMRARAQKSFEAITKSSQVSAADIVRAEKAKATELTRINEQQYGTQTSLISRLRSSWLQVAAALYLVERAAQTLIQPFVKGFYAVEQYNQSIASLAAMVVTFSERQKGVSLEDQWKEALKYSSAMVPVLENLAARTLLSGTETTALANAFARAGVFLDANNAKQVEAFTRVSNALPLMTQGQEIMRQINTEIRALMTGTGAANSMMLQTLKAIDPELEKHLDTWRKEGTVLEHIGDLLQGFGPATELLENQWQAVKSTLETTVTQIMRGMMEPAYQEIIRLTKDLNEWLTKNKGEIFAYWTAFRMGIIDVQAEIMRLAMLLDKVGGTMTSGLMLLYGPGSALGFESSKQRFESAAEANMEYERRYEATNKSLQDLANERMRLENSLSAPAGQAAIPSPPKGLPGTIDTTGKEKTLVKLDAKIFAEHMEDYKKLAADEYKAYYAPTWEAEEALAKYKKKQDQETLDYSLETYKRIGAEEEEIYNVKVENLERYEKDYADHVRKHGTLSQQMSLGAKQAFTDMQRDAKSAYDYMYQTSYAFAENSENTLSEVFFDAMSVDLDSFGDYWDSFWTRTKNTLAQTFAEMATSWASSEIKQILVGGAGGGGWIQNLLGPAFDVGKDFLADSWSFFTDLFHEGGVAGKDGKGRKLGPNEYGAVLIEGERVLTPEQSRMWEMLFGGGGAGPAGGPMGVSGQAGAGMTSAQAFGLMGLAFGIPGIGMAIAGALAGSVPAAISAAIKGKQAYDLITGIMGHNQAMSMQQAMDMLGAMGAAVDSGAMSQADAMGVLGAMGAGGADGGGFGGSGTGGDGGYGFGGGGAAGYGGYALGGLARGPESGYEARLHGTEMVVSQKRGVPARVEGGGEMTVIVPVYIDGQEVSRAVYKGVYTASKNGRIVLHQRGQEGYYSTVGLDI